METPQVAVMFVLRPILLMFFARRGHCIKSPRGVVNRKARSNIYNTYMLSEGPPRINIRPTDLSTFVPKPRPSV